VFVAASSGMARRFPWRRALPGLCATGVALISLLIAGSIVFMRGTTIQPFPSTVLPALTLILEVWKIVGANWIILALVLSIISVQLSMRIASRKT
jgi:hypothetical protein